MNPCLSAFLREVKSFRIWPHELCSRKPDDLRRSTVEDHGGVA